MFFNVERLYKVLHLDVYNASNSKIHSSNRFKQLFRQEEQLGYQLLGLNQSRLEVPDALLLSFQLPFE